MPTPRPFLRALTLLQTSPQTIPKPSVTPTKPSSYLAWYVCKYLYDSVALTLCRSTRMPRRMTSDASLRTSAALNG